MNPAGTTRFKNRTLAIATMHGKETVISPLMETSLQVHCRLVPGINTDLLGTFSGEIERKQDPLETLRLKCELGMNLSGADLVIASEGSFGQHPHVFFAKANEELVMIKDRINQLEIVANYLTTETNFDGSEVTDLNQVMAFAEKALFPSHALILKEHQQAKTGIEKGITQTEHLLHVARKLLKKSGKLWIETDMRALYNPTRMLAIQQATRNLIQKLESSCPSCHFPGFWISRIKNGLPCKQCGAATRSTYSHVYQCLHCKHEKEMEFPHSRYFEDPMYCDICNP